MTAATSRRTFLAGATVSAISCSGASLSASAAEPKPDQTLTVSSPNGAISIALALPKQSADYPKWSAKANDRVIRGGLENLHTEIIGFSASEQPGRL
ncbi:hypothetical protein, partial [Sphingobium salicis]|uniref:hypothetical protein n=1 Tax=Sphingobium sp. 11R-BB TaxID=3111639 RepID=UPI003C1CF8B6